MPTRNNAITFYCNAITALNNAASTDKNAITIKKTDQVKIQLSEALKRIALK